MLSFLLMECLKFLDKLKAGEINFQAYADQLFELLDKIRGKELNFNVYIDRFLQLPEWLVHSLHMEGGGGGVSPMLIVILFTVVFAYLVVYTVCLFVEMCSREAPLKEKLGKLDEELHKVSCPQHRCILIYEWWSKYCYFS